MPMNAMRVVGPDCGVPSLNGRPMRLACACMLSAALVLVPACGSPPLRVTRSSSGITIDVQTLGEYQTTISRIRLTDSERQAIVWEVAANGGTPQLHTIPLIDGVNAVLPFNAHAGAYKVVAPRGRPTFTLERGRTYKIEVWGERGRPAGAAFTL